MMTVRFPNGFSVQYNTAGYISRSANYADLYTQKDGAWIAQVPHTAIIEVVTSCRNYQAQQSATADQLDSLSREVRLLKRTIARLVKEIK